MSATFAYLTNVIMESSIPFLQSPLDIPSVTTLSFRCDAFMYVDHFEHKSCHSIHSSPTDISQPLLDFMMKPKKYFP